MYQRTIDVVEGQKTIIAVKGGKVKKWKIRQRGYGYVSLEFSQERSESDNVCYYVLNAQKSKLERAIVSKCGAMFARDTKKPIVVFLGKTSARLHTRQLKKEGDMEKIVMYRPNNAESKIRNYVIDFTSEKRKNMVQEVQLVALN